MVVYIGYKIINGKCVIILSKINLFINGFYINFRGLVLFTKMLNPMG